MPTVRTPAIGLFEGELFSSPFVVEWANRRIAIRPTEYHAPNDFDARTERDRIGLKPASFMHDTEYGFLASDESDVESIARDAVGVSSHHRQEGKARLVLVMGPQGGRHDIGEHQVGYEYAADQSNPTSPPCNLFHV